MGHTVVQIYGKNFGGTDFNPQVWLGGTICESVLWLSDSQVECRAPIGIGENHSVILQVGGQTSLSKNLFEYDRPLPEEIYPATGVAIGKFNITIGGVNFGFIDHGVEARIGDKPCIQTWWLSDSAIVCTVPPGSGQDLPIRIRVADRWSVYNGTTFAYDGPTVMRVEPNSCATVGGCRVKITGENYGLMPIPSLKVFVGEEDRFGASECTSVHWTSPQQLECTVGPGIGIDANVEIRRLDRTSPINQAFAYFPPIVLSISPSHGPPAGGTELTIIGSEFGASQNGQTIQFGYVDAYDAAKAKAKGKEDTLESVVQCVNTTWHSASMLTCISPEAEGFDLKVVAQVGDQFSDDGAGVLFSHDAPVIALTDPQKESTMAGGRLTIKGLNLSPGVNAVIGSANGESGGLCRRDFKYSDYNNLVCALPRGVGAEFEVSLVVEGRRFRQSASELPYLGCFKDCKGGARDLPESKTLGAGAPRMTPEVCADLCGTEYKYAGVQEGDKCFCGNYYGSMFEAKADACSSSCAGNSVRQCGGECTNSVFNSAARQKNRRVNVGSDEKSMKMMTTDTLPDYLYLVRIIAVAELKSQYEPSEGCDFFLDNHCRRTLRFVKKDWGKGSVARMCNIEGPLPLEAATWAPSGSVQFVSKVAMLAQGASLSSMTIYDRPFSVQAEMRGTNDGNCVTMTLMGSSGDQYDGLSLQTGLWNTQLRLVTEMRNTAPKGVEFIKLTSGTCEGNGYDAVTIGADCKRAGEALNIRTTEEMAVQFSSSAKGTGAGECHCKYFTGSNTNGCSGNCCARQGTTYSGDGGEGADTACIARGKLGGKSACLNLRNDKSQKYCKWEAEEPIKGCVYSSAKSQLTVNGRVSKETSATRRTTFFAGNRREY